MRPLGDALRRLGAGLLDAAVPQTCVSCGTWLPTGLGLACAACRAALAESLGRPMCTRCGRTLPAAAIHEADCARCGREAHWNVAGVARVGAYGEVERRVLLGLKYRGHERNAGVLAEWLAEALARQPWGRELEALVPVPMHWLRRLQRPCDHARVLAEALGRRLNLPVVRLVRRARHSPSQTGMTTKTQRFENVKGCFAPPLWWLPAQGPWAWRRGRLAARVAGRTVCIIDNLLVTGATVTEVSKVLRRAGARRIYVAVVSRAPSPGDAPAGAPPALVAGADSAAGEPAAAPGWFEL